MESYRILSLFIALCCCGRIWTVDYEVVGDYDRFIESCSKEDDKGNAEIFEFLDVSSVKRTYTDELDFVYFTGNVFIKKSLPHGYPIKVATDILYWSGNQWVNTIYSIRRNDLCKDLLDPSEFWYEFMSQLTEQQRVCPPEEGTTYAVEKIPNRMKVSLSTTAVPSKIKILSHLSIANYTLCVTIFAHVYKI